MTVKGFLSNFKPVQGGGGSNSNAEAERLKRIVAEQSAQLEAEKAEKTKLADAIAKAAADRDNTLRTTFLTTAATKNRALNPAHVVKLIGDDFEVKDGKVLVKGKPETDPDAHIAEWFTKDGKAYASPAVATGAGAPQNAGTTPQVAPLDLKTNEGMTQFARGLSVSTAPAAPQQK